MKDLLNKIGVDGFYALFLLLLLIFLPVAFLIQEGLSIIPWVLLYYFGLAIAYDIVRKR